MYGMDAYLMIVHEVEKARLASRAREGRKKEQPFPTGSPPATAGERIRETNPKEVTT